jgi:hypothetical protein
MGGTKRKSSPFLVVIVLLFIYYMCIYHRYDISLDSRWRHPYIHHRSITSRSNHRYITSRSNHRYITSRSNMSISANVHPWGDFSLLHRYNNSLDTRWRHPYIHGLCTVGWVDIGIRTTVRLGKVHFWGRRCKQTEVPPGLNISWYRHVGSRSDISMVGSKGDISMVCLQRLPQPPVV